MTDKDRPGDIWGRSERTIIRPNPGSRRPVSPPAVPSEAPQQATPSSVQYPVPPPAKSADARPEEWISTQRQTPAAPGPEKAPDLNLADLIAPNPNPLLRAAAPLLVLLGRLHVALLRASFASLMEQVSEAIKLFEKDVRSAGVSDDQATLAKYVLCATADDIVQNIPTEDRHVWTQYSMLSRFFGERTGGVRFFQELERALLDPMANYLLLELQHSCLALGFQGVHRSSAGGQAALQRIQRNLYETLRRVRPKVNQDLSPRWQGQQLPSRGNRVIVPIWAVAAAAAALLLGLFLLFRFLLAGSADVTVDQLAHLHPDSKLAIERRVFAPPPPPPTEPVDRITQLQRIRAALKTEISAGKLNAEQNATTIFIRVGDVVLFEPGQATVLNSFKPVIPKIAAALNAEPGNIKVVGHSDSTPIKTVRFPSNWHLSVERAKAVGALLKQSLSNPGRVETDGKGADMPIASNETAQGRARNRRVEITIPRED
jgi:type VI secretion system protein ImpK